MLPTYRKNIAKRHLRKNELFSLLDRDIARFERFHRPVPRVEMLALFSEKYSGAIELIHRALRIRPHIKLSPPNLAFIKRQIGKIVQLQVKKIDIKKRLRFTKNLQRLPGKLVVRLPLKSLLGRSKE